MRRHSRTFFVSILALITWTATPTIAAPATRVLLPSQAGVEGSVRARFDAAFVEALRSSNLDAVELFRTSIGTNRFPGTDQARLVRDHLENKYARIKLLIIAAQHRYFAVAAVSIVAIQTVLIAGLLLQRRKRQRAEGAARALAGRLLTAQESERTRIARDLHDGLGQEVAALSLAVSTLKRSQLLQGRLTWQMVELQERATTLAQSVRSLSHDLHPTIVRHIGVIAALKAHCSDIQSGGTLRLDFYADAAIGEMPMTTQVAVYRIAQEAISNAVKHGAATRVRVLLARNGATLELTIADDGKGFDVRQSSRWSSGLGLVSMEERARLLNGRVTISSHSGRGTSIRARFPISSSTTRALREERDTQEEQRDPAAPIETVQT